MRKRAEIYTIRWLDMDTIRRLASFGWPELYVVYFRRLCLPTQNLPSAHYHPWVSEGLSSPQAESRWFETLLLPYLRLRSLGRPVANVPDSDHMAGDR